MIVFYFALNLYFAIVLGVSGLAKAEDPDLLAETLRRHRILPLWSIVGMSRIIPSGEIVLASLLVAGVTPMATTVVVFALFASFFAIEATLLMTRRPVACGCYGNLYERKVDHFSLVTSAVFVCLAALQVWGAAHETPVGWVWRLLASSLWGSIACMLLWKVSQRRRNSATLGEWDWSS